MAIGLEHLRGPSGEQWTGMSPPQQRSQYPQQKKSQAPQSPFGPQQSVQTSMGNFPNLQAYQQQQDAFVQQHLKNQAQYNQGLQSGQSPQRVPVMDAWKQAGENIQSGQYQGNPFQTGNVDAIMGMFNQYGIQAPQGFRDQLLQNLGQQSAPPMYQPQWDYYKDPREMSPGGFIQPGPSQPPQPMYQPQRDYNLGSHERSLGEFIQPGPIQPPQPAMGYPGGPMPPGQMPSNGGFIDAREPGMGYQAVMVPYYNPATGETTSRTAGVVPAPGSGWVRGTGPAANQQQPQMTYPGGPSNDFIPKFTDPTTGLPYGQQPPMTYPGGPAGNQNVPSRTLMNPSDGVPYAPVGPQDYYTGYGDPSGTPKFTNPGTGLPYGQRPRDLLGDWGFGDYGPEPPRTPDQQRMDAMIRQQAEAAVMPPNPSDPWSYPLRPGHTRGPSGEQIMTREAREAEIRRMEQESGRTYVRPKAGVTQGGWLPPAKPKPGASISLSPEQAAAMKQYMDSRQSGRAQPTPARTRGTPYRSGKK